MVSPPLDAARARFLSRVFGSLDFLAALVLALGVFAGLPSRWWVVDVPAAIVVGLLAGAGSGLWTRAPWGEALARIASKVALGLGLLLVATLALTASYLSGIYGPVGRGGAVVLVLVAALALAYLVALPASQLLWLGPSARREPVAKPQTGDARDAEERA
jgi:hypothetical protein